MDIRVKTKCPYCGHVNDTPVAVTSADVYQRFVVNCDDAADGGCGCDYVATARIRVVVETLRSLEIEGEREYLERQNADAAGEVDSHPAQRR